LWKTVFHSLLTRGQEDTISVKYTHQFLVFQLLKDNILEFESERIQPHAP